MQSIEHPIQPVTGPAQNRDMGSRSNTTNSMHNQRPGSRGSTTSLQSVEVGIGYQRRRISSAQANSQVLPEDGSVGYPHNPEEVLLQHYHMSQQHMAPQPGVSQYDVRPHSQHGFPEMHQYPIQYGSNGVPHYPMHPAGMPQQHMHHHMRQQSEHYLGEGSPAPDDSNTEAGGAKRRKGTASSAANDQELRKLLDQYEGKTLKEVAAEVQRNEGAGGKSEKAKQVFAMLWLRENCRRSTNSVRRDRVFSRYTERCGNERVPTLNPASFGKLVRIIFPNVQTRRLGVRGESKYHYVDLSLFPDEGEQYPSTYQQPTPEENLSRQNSGDGANRTYQSHLRTVSMPQTTIRQSTEMADFPAPSSTFPPRSVDESTRPAQKVEPAASVNMDCQYLNTPTIRIATTGMAPSLIASLPSLRSNMPATLSTYLSMPSDKSHTPTPPNSQDSPIDLPDIHSYLAGVNYDVSIANSLSHLYRSYCIDVIDAFRKCKEKPFFNHHSAFNGKMTVPVAKLFSLEQLAPWIQESDMRMYKQMVRFLAPLALQTVPDLVFGVFDRVSSRLVSHLVAAFDEKCPAHVVIAKIVPAARFANLLKKLKGVNAGAIQMAKMFEDDNMRTQMWLDLVAIVDPEKVIDDSLPPPDALEAVEGILRRDLKRLLKPMTDPAITAVEEELGNSYASFLLNTGRGGSVGIMNIFGIKRVGPLDPWIEFLESLPQAFEGHNPQCMINWHTGFWKSIMTQLGLGGAPSYQAWYFMEPFMTSMLRWMTQMEGMLLDEGLQKELDGREELKKRQLPPTAIDRETDLKRKRAAGDVGGEERSRSGTRGTEKSTLSETEHGLPDVSHDQTAKVGVGLGLGFDGAGEDYHQHHENDDDDDMDEIRRSGPLDLPSINTASSPLKRQPGSTSQQVHDDSGIDLGLDLENGSADVEHTFKREGWLLSDPVDAEGHVVVI